MSYVLSIQRLAETNPYSANLVQKFWHGKLETHIEPLAELPYELNVAPVAGVFPIRFPSNKHSIDDTPAWPLEHFASRIGANGYNYVDGLAEFAIFESDCGHGGNAQTPEQIEENNARLKADSRVTASRSTGGKGVHYRVRFTTPVSCSSLAEYNRLCAYVADQHGMTDKTCAKGGFFWFWATTANAENKGFEPLFEATATFTVPDNWHELVPATRVRTGTNKIVELTDGHNTVVDAVANAGGLFGLHEMDGGGQAWHVHLKIVEQVWEELKLKGSFSTISKGSNLNKPNGYLIPNDGDSFRVYRFGTTAEPGWNKRQRDGKSWCYLNRFTPSEWEGLCIESGATRPTGRGRKTFIAPNYDIATKIMRAVGTAFPRPEAVSDRQVTLTLDSATVQLEIPRQNREQGIPEGWVITGTKKYGCSVAVQLNEVDHSDSFDIDYVKVGYHYSEVGQQYGETLYYVQHDDGTWKPETASHVSAMLLSDGMPGEAVRVWVGKQIRKPFKISCKPFAKDSDDPTVWNRGYKFACDPIKGDHPHWDKVIRHTFEYLTPYVKEDPWCQANRIEDGYDFGVANLAMMVQFPERRSPHYFLYSKDQGTGKDSFVDAAGLLMEPGAVVNANDAVTSGSGFNGELEGKVIYKINEIDLSKSGSTAESRCRDWVTSPILHIHRKGITPYDVVNYGRVFQMANDLSYKLVSTEDARTIVIELSKIAPEKHLDWETELKPKLVAERAAFLHTLLNYDLPEHGAKGSRCFFPILATEAKAESIAANLTPLQGNVAHLFEQIVAKAHRGEWRGELEYTDIVRLVDDVPSNSKSWGAVWRRLEPHFRAHGLNPTHRPRVEHQSAAAWGFAAA